MFRVRGKREHTTDRYNLTSVRLPSRTWSRKSSEMRITDHIPTSGS